MKAELIWDSSNGWRIHALSPEIRRCGAKAFGLTSVPDAWSAPWVVVPLESCGHAHQAGDWGSAAKSILDHFRKLSVSCPNGLLVRSSAPSEDIDLRGQFDSKRCSADKSALEKLLRSVAFQTESEPAAKAEVQCAVIVQKFLPPDWLGHLSNEYRHAQRSVDFIFEVDAGSSVTTSDRSRSFRLQRPVSEPDASGPLTLGPHPSDTSLVGALHIIAAWLAAHNRRGHVEWVVSGGRLFVVQFDVEIHPQRIYPMAELPSIDEARSRGDEALRIFQSVERSEQLSFSNLRKTRSHALLHAAGAFVPPIYVATNVGVALLQEDSDFWRDLEDLLGAPVIIRFDVPLSRAEWTNLPTLGPLTSLSEARAKIADAVVAVRDRGILLDEIAIVVHHFIAARASAWSEVRPNSTVTRIDAIWGLPDGLQSFVHDSLMCDHSSNNVTTHLRYKDRFIDVDSRRLWVTRRAFPSLARDPACTVDTARLIARTTSLVSEITGKPVRIMWFLDVVRGGGGESPAAMPWIVVEVEPDSDFTVPWQGAPEHLRRLAELHSRKAITNRVTLARFEQEPSSMDLGGRHVLLQPDASVVRDRKFLSEFAATVRNLPNHWKVLYAGSMLAHAPYQLRQHGVVVLPLHAEFRPPRRMFSRKLVRDQIPEQILAGGEHAEVATLTDEQFGLALRQKLIEEALEVAYAAGQSEVREELADLLTVAKKIASSAGVSEWRQIEDAEQEKTGRRGGFDARLYLRATGYPPSTTEEEPGGAHIRRLKEREGVRIPLIPPLNSRARIHEVRLPRTGFSMLIIFREREVDVFLLPITRSWGRDRQQLSLFDD